MLTSIAVGTFIVLVLVFIAPWWMVNWGTVSLREGKTVTVIGTADSMVSNEVATFNAGFNAVSENKDEAVSAVDAAMTELIGQVKSFGIPDEDIQTSGNSIYQEEEPITVGGRQTSEPGRWRVSNNITIKLRDIARVQELNDLLASSGANNVWGPTFEIDGTEADNELLGKALENAREKADILAQASGKSVGAVLSITESGATSAIPFFSERDMGGGGGIPVESGSQTISKSVMVTFELR